MNKNWMPGRRELQLAMAKNWYGVLNRNAQRWGIPNGVETELESLTGAARDVLADAMSSDRTATVTARCKEAFEALVAYMRDTKKRYFLEPPLTDSDLVNLGLNPPDATPTAIRPPSAQVEADITFPGIHLIELKKIRPVAGAEPDGKSDYGVRIFWGLTGTSNNSDKFRVTETPHSGNDLPHSKFTRRMKERFDFDGESANTVYFCLRYENSKGEAGPFGPILKAVIP